MGRYAFPLCIQMSAPVSLTDAAFCETVKQLSSLDFYGVELNIVDFQTIAPAQLGDFLAEYSLRMTMLATGAFAKRENLSLGSNDEAVRQKTVNVMCRQVIPYAEAMGCGIICGFIKGQTNASCAQLQKSIAEIAERTRGMDVPLYLEATNHYDSNLVCTLGEAAAHVTGPWKILPDTYHMNIEERSLSAALVKYRHLYDNVHISDNNRRFPGFGAIDFYQILSLLKALDYRGFISIEGNAARSLGEDVVEACRYLEAVSSRML